MLVPFGSVPSWGMQDKACLRPDEYHELRKLERHREPFSETLILFSLLVWLTLMQS
jgi:hypothetical protein